MANFRALPSLQSIKDPAIRSMMEAIKENLERAYGVLGNEGFITTASAQRLVEDIDIPITDPGTGEPPVLPIPTIEASDITAFGTFQSIILSWPTVYDFWLAYFEIFRAQTSLVGDAVSIASTPDHVYEDFDVTAGETYWYWIRVVQKTEAGGDMGPLPTIGKEATVNEDPSVILDRLIGNITESHLFQTLSSRIDLIDQAGPGSVNARIEAAREAEAALRISGDQALYDADLVIQASVDGLSTRMDTAEGGISANASQISYLATLVDELGGGGEYGAEAFLALEARVTITEQDNIAQGSAISALDSRVTISEGQVTAHSDSITAIESDIGVLQGETYNLGLDAIAQAQAVQLLQTDVSQQRSDLSALASATTQISTTVGGHTTSIEQHAESIDGLEGQYSVKIDQNGKIIGFGLSTGSAFGEIINHLNNPGLDSWVDAVTPTGWTRYSGLQYGTEYTVDRESSIKCAGDYSVKISVVDGAGYVMLLQDLTPASEWQSQICIGGVWVWADTPGKARVMMDYGAYGTIATDFHPGDSSWHYLQFAFGQVTVPPVATTLRFCLYVASGCTAYFDDATLGRTSDVSGVSEFAIRADKFYVVLPTGDGSTQIIPFIVGSVNGQSTVGVNGALVVDGTILARHISSISLSVIKAVVSQLSAITANLGSITAGSINIGNGMAIIDAAGQATFNAPTLKSTNYSPGATGWQLTRNGTLDINVINCIKRINLGANTITIPASGTLAANIYTNPLSTWISVVGATLNPEGQKVVVQATAKLNVVLINSSGVLKSAQGGSSSAGSFLYSARIYRSDGTVLYSAGTEVFVPPAWGGNVEMISISITDTASLSVALTYYLQVNVWSSGWLGWYVHAPSSYVSQATITALGCMR